jgi:hypothetical protein
MMIYVNSRSSKKLKAQQKRKQAKRLDEYNSWLADIDKMTPNFSGKFGKVKPNINEPKIPKLSPPPGRETKHYPSLKTELSNSNCTKPVYGKVYTGTKMLGIGTLHKSNAVPIFSEEEAKDQAAMRR